MIHIYHWTADSRCAMLLGMNAQNYRLYIERKEPGRNMARFYVLSIEETLFGQTCLTRCWGRIGTRGRSIQHSFDNENEAVGLFLELLRVKKQRGYRPALPDRKAEAARLCDGAASVWVSRGWGATR